VPARSARTRASTFVSVALDAAGVLSSSSPAPMLAASDAKNIAVEPRPVGGASEADGAEGAYLASDATRDSARRSSASDQVRAA